MPNRTNCRRFARLGLCVVLLVVMAVGTFAASNPNTITFSNLSGKGAVVKLIGPVRVNVDVPNGAQATVNVPAGSYYFLVRYCDSNGACTYSQGDPLEVIQTPTQYSVITITLHTVINGNYHERPASRDEFDGN
jgi:hypothetical protein